MKRGDRGVPPSGRWESSRATTKAPQKGVERWAPLPWTCGGIPIYSARKGSSAITEVGGLRLTMEWEESSQSGDSTMSLGKGHTELLVAVMWQVTRYGADFEYRTNRICSEMNYENKESRKAPRYLAWITGQTGMLLLRLDSEGSKGEGEGSGGGKQRDSAGTGMGGHLEMPAKQWRCPLCG